MTADRKKDAREKFRLGGIVVRAGLTRADCAFLIGGLLELARVAPNSSGDRGCRLTSSKQNATVRSNHLNLQIK
ncbi:conjugal transfer protein TraD [Sinorhizobium meliloti]|uniref:conjugal transfer protein TraD n=1 Tax=Rhizobium meliloti TaxID=382 RepID=UPI000FD97973|nr:conjugal transfer protein TraD [Sinorhizobium meliloti]RVQ48048.1 conjugal transfer protein TraD [Sinorhizobium meliloti]